jgi:hypothetical protein
LKVPRTQGAGSGAATEAAAGAAVLVALVSRTKVIPIVNRSKERITLSALVRGFIRVSWERGLPVGKAI